mgnify:CR=1 FL=1
MTNDQDFEQQAAKFRERYNAVKDEIEVTNYNEGAGAAKLIESKRAGIVGVLYPH